MISSLLTSSPSSTVLSLHVVDDLVSSALLAVQALAQCGSLRAGIGICLAALPRASAYASTLAPQHASVSFFFSTGQVLTPSLHRPSGALVHSCSSANALSRATPLKTFLSRYVLLASVAMVVRLLYCSRLYCTGSTWPLDLPFKSMPLDGCAPLASGHCPLVAFSDSL